MSYDDVLAGISKKTRDRLRRASEISLERLEMPSAALTNDLGGGIGLGRQTLIWGSKSAGKSSLCLEMAGNAQRSGKTVAIIDSESSYDKEWAARLGVNNDEILVSRVKTIYEAADIGCELMKAGVDLLIVDSISSLLPSSYFKDDDLRGMQGTKQIGSQSKDLASAVQLLNYSNNNTALVLISQVRNKITTYGASQQPMGGHAVLFYSTASIRLTSSARDNDQITKEYSYGKKKIKRPVGRTVTYHIDFNKIGKPGGAGTYDFYYGGDDVGIDKVGEIVDLAISLGVVEQRGSWLFFGDEKWQGRHALIDNVKKSAALDKALRNEVE